MLPKAPVITPSMVVTTLGNRDTSIQTNLDIVIMNQLRSIIKQNNAN